MKKNFYANKPGKLEYKNMGHEFRPYVLFTNAENYRTSIVNTDRLGFRKTFFKKKLIGIDELTKYSTSQNIIIGGSTAFSMGSTSDKTTINSILNSSGNLWFSLGVRGAVGHQELITFLTFKRFFSKINNVVIFSGLNDVIMCAEKHSMYYNDFGGILGSSVERFHAGYLQSSSFFKSKLHKGRANFIHLVSYLSYKSSFFKFLLRNLFSRIKTSTLQKKTMHFSSSLTFKKKLSNLKKLIENDFQIWAALSKQFNINITYILQPTATWTKRKPTANEKEIISYEKKRIKDYFNFDFTKKNLYISHKNFLKKTCQKNFIKFYDANELIVKAKKDKDIFIDYTHLSDYGNSFMAKTIIDIVKNKNK